MKKLNKWVVRNLHWLIVLGVAALCAVFLICGHTSENGKYITLDGSDAQISDATEEFIDNANKAMIEYAETAIPTIITNADGTTETIDAPTVESVDSGELQTEKCEEEECGQGAYVYAPTDTYTNFKNYTLGKCWNVDGAYGAQCWDLGALFWMNYTSNGRTLSTCGTGAASGAWNCKETNAGSEFDLIYNASEVKAGDWIIFGGGQYGHVGMALGGYNNGYVALLGQNQGGSSCAGGGAATNIINISLKNFKGAFRPKTYITPEPTPTPTPTPEPTTGEVSYTYVKGDYFSKVLVQLGYDEGKLWGEDGSVRYYTNQLIEQGVLDSRGNVKIGVPFTLTRR